MDDIRNLKTNWQARLGVSGAVVQGYDALDQYIRVALATQLGSVPQMLDFGIDWFEIIDRPLDEARPRLLRGAAAVFRKWIEPRATLNRIEVSAVGSSVTAKVYYTPANSSDPRTVEVAA